MMSYNVHNWKKKTQGCCHTNICGSAHCETQLTGSSSFFCITETLELSSLKRNQSKANLIVLGILLEWLVSSYFTKIMFVWYNVITFTCLVLHKRQYFKAVILFRTCVSFWGGRSAADECCLLLRPSVL